jgi:hypothetical protein
MRYFSRGWAEGDLDDEEEARLEQAYVRRLDAIAPQLSEPVRRLAREVNLHDAIIETIRWRGATQELTLALATVDTASRYHTVVLTYLGVQLGNRQLEALRDVACDRETEILYHEVDRDDADGLLAHRLLFWPRDELTIFFRALRLDVTPRADRRVELGSAFVTDDE